MYLCIYIERERERKRERERERDRERKNSPVAQWGSTGFGVVEASSEMNCPVPIFSPYL